MQTRRAFLTTSAALTLGAPAVHALGANERLNIGLIGCGNRGRTIMSEAVKKLPVRDFVYPQFTGHTVTSPYSYVPSYSSSTTTATATTQTQPAWQAEGRNQA